MERTDLIPELVAVLAQDDPRLPVIHEKEGKKVSTVREMVKINHHRNCMMCHAPGNPSTGSANAMTAEVPVMGQPLPSPLEGYRQSSPDLMIRIDVTYLRQDFSALLPVADAQPWPDSQRFDFFVRERKLTDEEATLYRGKLTPKEAGVLSPYHKAALAALRELTGKDTTPTAEAWRNSSAREPRPLRLARACEGRAIEAGGSRGMPLETTLNARCGSPAPSTRAIEPATTSSLRSSARHLQLFWRKPPADRDSVAQRLIELDCNLLEWGWVLLRRLVVRRERCDRHDGPAVVGHVSQCLPAGDIVREEACFMDSW